MELQKIPAREGNHNLQNYEKMRETFQWDDVNKNFSWNETGKVNMAHEAVDRHANNPNKKDQAALLYSAPNREEKVTFEQLRQESNKFANVLKKYNVNKGDRVFLFMPRIPEFYAAFFGILKTGAIAGPLFEAFMEQAVRDRLQDSEASVLVTTPDLLGRVPQEDLPDLEKIILIGDHNESTDTYIDYKEEMEAASADFSIEWVDLEDGMLIHYTSGSTGKPKGVYHVHNAMIQHYATAEWVLDLKEDDNYWCTADPGWVTGTSYGIFAPWLKGVTNVVRGGRFTPDDWYGALDKYIM